MELAGDLDPDAPFAVVGELAGEAQPVHPIRVADREAGEMLAPVPVCEVGWAMAKGSPDPVAQAVPDRYQNAHASSQIALPRLSNAVDRAPPALPQRGEGALY